MRFVKLTLYINCYDVDIICHVLSFHKMVKYFSHHAVSLWDVKQTAIEAKAWMSDFIPLSFVNVIAYLCLQPNGPLTRNVKLWVAHAPGLPGMFPRHELQSKLLVTDPDMHHGTCVTHVPLCMSGSLTHGGAENVPGIPGACATHNFTYLARGPC